MKQFIYTLRYLGKTKATNIIKVLSLTLGLAMGLVIFAQIAFERLAKALKQALAQ